MAKRKRANALPSSNTLTSAGVVKDLIVSGKITRERSCDEKARFKTAEKAVRSAARWREKEGTDFVPYACPFCHGFHLATPMVATPQKEIA